MNKVILSGRLTSDPDVRYTQNQQPIALFNLAVRNGKETIFINNITSWDKLAEFTKNYLHKGTMVNIVGKLNVRSYDDKEGKHHKVTEIVASEIEFAESKKEQQEEFTPVTDDMLPF